MKRQFGVLPAFIALSALALGAVACGNNDAGGDVDGRQWTLVEVDGVSVPEEITATLTYDGEMVFGSGGCNTYRGEAAFDAGDVQISEQLAVTMMACAPEVTDVEMAFFVVLAEAERYTVDGDTLTLADADGDPLAILDAS